MKGIIKRHQQQHNYSSEHFVNVRDKSAVGIGYE